MPFFAKSIVHVKAILLDRKNSDLGQVRLDSTEDFFRQFVETFPGTVEDIQMDVCTGFLRYEPPVETETKGLEAFRFAWDFIKSWKQRYIGSGPDVMCILDIGPAYEWEHISEIRGHFTMHVGEMANFSILALNTDNALEADTILAGAAMAAVLSIHQEELQTRYPFRLERLPDDLLKKPAYRVSPEFT